MTYFCITFKVTINCVVLKITLAKVASSNKYYDEFTSSLNNISVQPRPVASLSGAADIKVLKQI